MRTTSTDSKVSSSGSNRVVARRTFIVMAATAAGLAGGLLLPRVTEAPAATLALSAVVTGLDNPWGMAFLPDGNALVTERPGQLRHVSLTDRALSPPIAGLPEIDARGQGGLLGIAIDPDFTENRLVYLSFAEPREAGNSTSVFRARLSEDHARLDDGRIIFRQNLVADSGHHFGSRLVFDRSGNLFVTTGDRNRLREAVQDPANHIGKVLRITRDGEPAPGNPMLPGWAPEVWSIGHRNIQGAALHPETGALWTAEHGARGGDEINTPEAGKNYGWPVISYGREYSTLPIGEGSEKPGMEQPLHYWDPSIAPSGMSFYTGSRYPGWTGSLFVGALAGEHLSRLTLDGTRIVSEEKLFEGFGRFRDVVQGPDGNIYVLTDEGTPDGAMLVIADQPPASN